MLDSIDQLILKIVQEDGRVTNADLARQVGLTPSAVLERVRKLEGRGVIQGYEARLNPRALGAGLLAFVFVRAEERLASQETGRFLASIPEVQEVHHIAGEDCYLVKVRVADTEALGRLLRERFGDSPTVRSTRTTIVLSTVKESARVPLEHLRGEEDNE